MSKPHIAGHAPMILDLEPGTYWWCACGRSKEQPYCDGSHRGTGLAPVRVEITEPARKALCLCKRTEGQPFCDGSHSEL